MTKILHRRRSKNRDYEDAYDALGEANILLRDSHVLLVSQAGLAYTGTVRGPNRLRHRLR